MTRVGLLGVGLLALASLAAGCGDDKLTAEEVVQRAYEAVDEPGTVYHVVADNGSELWMDTEEQLYRRKDATEDGGLISTGEGWEKTTFDVFNNVVQTQDESPNPDLLPRIDNPAVQWLEPLTALAYARGLELVGRTVSVDGRPVLAVIGRSPIIEGEQATGGFLAGRVEVDPDTYDILLFERRREAAPGEELTSEEAVVTRIAYEPAEHLDRAEFPEDFFAKSVVEQQIVTLEENIDGIRELGIDPYWLGEEYEVRDGVSLVLNREQGGVIVDSENGEGSVHYGMVVPAGSGFQGFPETVVIKLGPAGTEFSQPSVEDYSGDLPEQAREVTVRGVPGVMARSILTPGDLECPVGQTCAESDEPLYYSVTFTLGDTAIQLETSARVDQVTGEERNVYNNDSGILELADALFIAEVTAE